MVSILIVSCDAELIAWTRSRVGGMPVATAGSLREAASVPGNLAARVVVIDCGVPDAAVEAGWRLMRRRHAGAQLVVIFSPGDSERAIRLGFRAGARSVIPRRADLPLLKLAVDDALERAGSPPGAHPTPFLNPDLAELRRSHRLTPREFETLMLLAAGASNKQIAARLGLSPKTIRNRVSDILGKLGLESRSQAVIWVGQHIGEINRPDVDEESSGPGLPA